MKLVYLILRELIQTKVLEGSVVKYLPKKSILRSILKDRYGLLAGKNVNHQDKQIQSEQKNHDCAKKKFVCECSAYIVDDVMYMEIFCLQWNSGVSFSSA